MKFTIYFEIFGKKMKVDIEAPNEERAIWALREKIKVHKIVPIEDKKEPTIAELAQCFKDIFGGNIKGYDFNQ